MEIAESVIDGLFLSLIIPVVRPNTVKVLSHILCSAQSRALFMKIVHRIPRALQSILNIAQDSPIPPDIQLSIDLISIFCTKYGIYDSEIVSTDEKIHFKFFTLYCKLIHPFHESILFVVIVFICAEQYIEGL